MTHTVATSISADRKGVTCHVSATGPAGPVGATSDDAVSVPRTIAPGSIETTMLAFDGVSGARTNFAESLPVWSPHDAHRVPKRGTINSGSGDAPRATLDDPAMIRLSAVRAAANDRRAWWWAPLTGCDPDPPHPADARTDTNPAAINLRLFTSVLLIQVAGTARVRDRWWEYALSRRPRPIGECRTPIDGVGQPVAVSRFPLPVDEQALHGAEEARRPVRDAVELHQPVGERQTLVAAVELLLGDPAPAIVEDLGRVALDALTARTRDARPRAPAGCGGRAPRRG